MKSSLTFQMLLHLGSYVLGFFGLFEVAFMLYKYIVLPLPVQNVMIELFILCCLAICEPLRIFFSWKANLTESSGSMILAIILVIPGILGVLFFLLWQTYILRLEVILCGVVLSIQGLHAIFSLIAVVTFYSA